MPGPSVVIRKTQNNLREMWDNHEFGVKLFVSDDVIYYRGRGSQAPEGLANLYSSGPDPGLAVNNPKSTMHLCAGPPKSHYNKQLVNLIIFQCNSKDRASTSLGKYPGHQCITLVQCLLVSNA